MSNATLREALFTLQREFRRALPAHSWTNAQAEADLAAQAALAADDAARANGQQAFNLSREQASRAAAPQADAVFWLIERGPNQGQSPHCWWSREAPTIGLPWRKGEWVYTVHEATRFKSKSDADDAAKADGVTHFDVTSHGWIAAAPQSVEPVAFVPVHPRNGPLWANTTSDPSPERLPSYPLRALYFGSPTAPTNAEWQEEAMRLVSKLRAAVRDDCGAGASREAFNVAVAAEAALRAHIATRPAQKDECLSLLQEARYSVDDSRLYYNELDGRKRNETIQQHEDRISDWIQRNEDRKELLERIDALLPAPPTKKEAGV